MIYRGGWTQILMFDRRTYLREMILQTGDFVLEDELSDRAERRGQQRVLRERADAPRTRSRAAEGTSRMDCLSVPAERTEGWYLSLMAPSTKGPKYAWLDPSRLYCNSQVRTPSPPVPAAARNVRAVTPRLFMLRLQALADCVKDLLKPFQDEAIDLVAGIDAMGFILGSAVATTLGRGFLAIRKAGHLCVPTRTREYTDYSGREKTMEVRLDVLRPGLRVLIVDQWIETGGTMKAAIQLVEELGATVAGVAAVAIENSDGGRWIKQRYRHAHCIPERLQEQIDKQDLQTIRTVSGSDR
ncbi:uncharacterized protein LOC114802406 isoform X1 [Denticeps clupeoides]|uniref:uncharacterized protein LOC114802406 isoform X1 n=1 Tax=Denticeps clupeoides TaxID=299321 RepID=UPI0010A5422F|nr:uncharacterized protein LOC114802406 isoform X1 [Denticeps clupeoides]